MKKFVIGFVGFLVFACSNDDEAKNDNEVKSNQSMVRYEIRSKSVYQDGVDSSTYEKISIGNLHNGKLFSETHESFLNGSSQGAPIMIQYYFYNGDLLVKTKFDDDIKEFFYDSQNELNGINWFYKGEYSYYRFLHKSASIVYFEKITLPYNDVNLKVLKRIIVELDKDNNVIKAGYDNDLDGVIYEQCVYSYLNSNLIYELFLNGTNRTFSYSNTIDNFAVLKEKSYGKKVLSLLNSECYATASAFDMFNPSLYLTTEELLESNYEILDNNYYKKKTEVWNYSEPKAQLTIMTEFFFN